MIAKRTERGNDPVSNFRRRFNYLRRKLDCLDDLTHMAVDVPRSKPASYKRNDSLHTRAPTPFKVPTEWPAILDISAQHFSPTSEAVQLGTSRKHDLYRGLNRNVLRHQHDCESPTEQAQIQK